MVLLAVKDLVVSLKNGREIVKSISFEVNQGEAVALVGQSGSGKSMIAHAILQLFPKNAQMVIGGSIQCCGEELLETSDNYMQTIRGSKIAMIFQEALAALNPTMTVGDQILEAVCAHEKLSKADAQERVLELLAFVGISDPKNRSLQYPHEFSGGMRQRIVIAIALACQPALLIADEPTTALDVTIQAQILDLLRKIQREKKMGILLITHDLAVVAGFCDRVLILDKGEIVDKGSVDEIFYESKQPYTLSLLRSVRVFSPKDFNCNSPGHRPG